MQAHVFVPESAPAGKVAQIAVFGATVHRVAGARERATEAAEAFVAESGLPYATHNLSPYFIEGTKSFIYEALEQLGDSLPDHIVIPTGNGSLFIATHLALIELLDAGRIERIPRLHAVQARAAMPIVAAMAGVAWVPDEGVTTVAGGIASADPPRRGQILAALKETDGTAVAVDDADITRWRGVLAKHEGVYAESTSAAAFAGLEQLVKVGAISRGDGVLVPVTGSGLKEPL
jgi:threonine synthase